MKPSKIDWEQVGQTFCMKCGGVKVMTYKGKRVKLTPLNLLKFSMAVDMGCICR